ncbi:uncharacterized protein METZ01_LOCUS473217, partial [marine metagenome]
PPENQEPFPLFLGGQAQVQDGGEFRAEVPPFGVAGFVPRQEVDDSLVFPRSCQIMCIDCWTAIDYGRSAQPQAIEVDYLVEIGSRNS